MDANVVFAGCWLLGLLAIPVVAVVVTVRSKRARLAAITDTCVLCDADVDLDDSGDYACAACGVDTAAARRRGAAKWLDLGAELSQAERSAQLAVRLGGVLEPEAHLVLGGGAHEANRALAHTTLSDVLGVLDRAAAALPPVIRDASGQQREVSVLPASDRVADLVPAVRSARAAVRQLVLGAAG
ncbi:MAG: hypothetical protein ACI9K2_006097 [Myxococcota bacterium]|jgi:hypothetical protein